MYAFCILLTWCCHCVSKSQNLTCNSLELDFFFVNVFSESKSKGERKESISWNLGVNPSKSMVIRLLNCQFVCVYSFNYGIIMKSVSQISPVMKNCFLKNLVITVYRVSHFWRLNYLNIHLKEFDAKFSIFLGMSLGYVSIILGMVEVSTWKFGFRSMIKRAYFEKWKRGNRFWTSISHGYG